MLARWSHGAGGGQRVQRSMSGFCRNGCILRCAGSWRGDGNPLESSALNTALWAVSAVWLGLLRCKDSPSPRVLLRSTAGGSDGCAGLLGCKVLANHPLSISLVDPHRRLNGQAAGVKKPAGGTCGLWGSGLGAMRARHSTDQRLLIGSTSRRSAPVNSWRGRPILYSGSPIISFSWAIQPTVRASAKMAVNSDTGMPMARCTMPE